MNNPGTQLFETIKLEDTGVNQVMWPMHCVQGSLGSDLNLNLHYNNDKDIVVCKGKLERVDSYSGFGSYPEKTELEDILRNNQIAKVFSCGLAFDYCVGSTAIDAAKLGF